MPVTLAAVLLNSPSLTTLHPVEILILALCLMEAGGWTNLKAQIARNPGSSELNGFV